LNIFVQIVCTIQIVAIYLYQANELTTTLLTSKPSGVTMTNQYTQGDPNDKALLSASRGQRRGKAVQSKSATQLRSSVH
jgi:hypothetical protein